MALGISGSNGGVASVANKANATKKWMINLYKKIKG